MLETDMANSGNSTSVEQLFSQLAELQDLVSKKEKIILEQSVIITRERRNAFVAQKKLQICRHVMHGVETILSDFHAINVGDYVSFFNYLLNTLPERLKCDLKYYIPIANEHVTEMHDSDLFLALFENSYELMQSGINEHETKNFRSVLSREKLEVPIKKGLEIYPISIEDRVVGFVEFVRYDKSKKMVRSIQSAVNQTLQYISSHISQLQYVIILEENNLIIRKHISMIQTDLLTGINSRRGFFTKSGILLKKYPIANRAILAIDIDHFKLVNDRYGHSGGDKALQIVAKTLERKLEKIVSAINHANSGEGQKVYAEIGRIGGEEFVIQLVGVNSEQALKIGEELRVSIENRLSKFENGDTSMPTSSITISIGISTFQNIELDKMSNNQADIMEQADRALYYAKHTGRNRVISYNDNLLDIAQDSKKEEFLLPVRKNPRMEKSM